MQYKFKTPAQEDKIGTEDMIAYHGTDSDFSRFDNSFLGLNTEDNASSESLIQSAHIGFWFTENCGSAAEVYDKVLTCEVSIENPLECDSLETLEFWIESQEKSGEEIREMLIEQGYDGIVISYDEEFEGTSWIAFSADQISIIK